MKLQKYKPTRKVMDFSVDNDLNIINSDKKIVSLLRVKAINFDNLRDTDQQKYVDAFTYIIQQFPIDEVQIFKEDVKANLKDYMEQFDITMDRLTLESEIQSKQYRILEEEKLLLQQRIVSGEIKERYFYLVVCSKDNKEKDELHHSLQRLFSDENMAFEVVGAFESLIVLFNFLNPLTSQFVALPKLDIQKDHTIVNYLDMDSFSLADDGILNQYIISDGIYQKIFYIQGTPLEPPVGWLATFMGISEIDISIHLNKIDYSKSNKRFNKTKSALRQELDNERLKDNEIKQLTKEYQDVDTQQDKLLYGLQMYEFFATLRIKADSLEELKELEQNLIKLAGKGRYILKQGFGEQNALFESNAPVGVNKFKRSSYVKVISSDEIGWGFPFINESLIDQNMPIEIGKSFSGEVILLDTRNKTAARVNSNECVLGVSGSGKTTTLMNLIKSRFGRNEKQFIIDVVGKELVTLTHDLKGSVIDLSNNVNGMINPLQIRIDYETTNESDTVDLDKIFPVGLHLFFLRTFMSLVLGKDIENKGTTIRIIDTLLQEFYGTCGLTMETTAKEIIELENEDYPTFREFYDFVENKLINYDRDKGIVSRERMEDILVSLNSLGRGAESTIFSGHTNVDLEKSLLINFDLSRLQGKDSNVLAAQYYNVISNAWSYIITHKAPHFKRIYGDEIHAVLDPETPYISSWLRKISKENRKFECGLTIATQEAADLIRGDSSRDGNSLIANSTYKFLFMTDNDSRKIFEEKEVFDRDILEWLEFEAKQGEFLLQYGNAQIKVDGKLEADDPRLQYFISMTQ